MRIENADEEGKTWAFFSPAEVMYLADKEHGMSRYYRKRFPLEYQRVIGILSNTSKAISDSNGKDVSVGFVRRVGDELRVDFYCDAVVYASQGSYDCIHELIEIAEKERAELLPSGEGNA